jgi:RNA pol II promoter Fmp27 protein domain
MSALKFYHDLSCDADSLGFANGPCWKPVIAQYNLALDFFLPPATDPSPPLSFWDKMHLILHGRVTMSTQQLTLLRHTSLDPYSTTEEMVATWTDLAMDWINDHM